MPKSIPLQSATIFSLNEQFAIQMHTVCGNIDLATPTSTVTHRQVALLSCTFCQNPE